jgi:exopolyphosphatase/guanosine-5'-triphosphate,3'-diphosphate pyrophosphatase
MLAGELFDSTTPLHGLDAEDRELLELAALLHDIGEHVSRDGHARHSAYLIENGDLRGFSPIEIQMLACLGRYHVRGRPRESFQAWETLERKDRDRVLKLLSLLRIADGLDAAHGSVVGHVGVELSGRSVEIVVSAQGEAELERWLLQRKKLLFEELFEVPISLEVVPTGPEELQTRAAEAGSA